MVLPPQILTMTGLIDILVVDVTKDWNTKGLASEYVLSQTVPYCAK